MQPFPGRGRFFLLRHGVTDWNLEHRVMGRRPIALNDAGRRQVEELAPYLTGLGISRIWSSPLPRARATAEIVARSLGNLPVEEDAGLTEVHYADWEGLTFRDLRAHPSFAAFLRDPARTRFPGGGECLLDVQQRVFAAMGRIASAVDGTATLVVSHGDPLRLVVAGCLGLSLQEIRRLRVDNAALTAIELTGDWAEVKFMNLHPNLAALVAAGSRPAEGRPQGA